MWISAEQMPSLHRVAPRYLKLVISSNFQLFTQISALIVFVLLVMILLFSELTSIPCAIALSMNESVGEVLFSTAAAQRTDVGGKS